MVLDGRKVQPGWALKRPQGRAPVVLVNSTSEFGLKILNPILSRQRLNRRLLRRSGGIEKMHFRPFIEHFLPLNLR